MLKDRLSGSRKDRLRYNVRESHGGVIPPKGEGRPDPVAFGRSLKSGLGINLLVRDVATSIGFLNSVLAVEIAYWDDDFAICQGYGALWMLHHDRTYRHHPFLSAIGGLEARGGGIELRLYGCSPDRAAAQAEAFDAVVLAHPEDKPHGTREAYIVDPDGYVWAPTVPQPGDTDDG